MVGIKDVVVWGTECTLDVMLKLDQEQFKDILTIFMTEGINGEYKSLFEGLLNSGLKRDEEIKGIDQQILMSLMRYSYEVVKEGSEQRREFIGGSPCISAYASKMLANGHSSFPDIFYVGSLPSTVQSYIEIMGDGFKEFFKHSVKNEYCPITLSIEVGTYKLMLANSKGRNLSELDKEKYIKAVSNLMNEYNGNRVMAFGGLNKGSAEEYLKLFSEIMANVPGAKLFLGTNSFSRQNEEQIRKMYKLLETADIISLNDAELTDVAKAVLHRDERHIDETNISLSQKLRYILPSKLKICHSAEGAIMDANDESRRMNGNCDFSRILQFCTDAASYSYAYGYNPTHIEAIVYSNEIISRQREGFYIRFIMPSEMLSEGISSAIAPKIEEGKGTLTGIGAIFDGYLLSCLLSKHLF